MNANMSTKANGVLQFLPRGGGFLRDPALSFQPSSEDVWVSSKLIHQYGLAEGAVVTGSAIRGKKGCQLDKVDSVCGLPPEQFKARTPFERLTAIDPRERIRLGDEGNVSMRVIELIAPVGKGTRGLIVAPPKTGKTRLLEEIAKAVHSTEPDTRIVALLIDERPEEVTHFRRNVPAEVLASSNDQRIQTHVNLAELTLAHIRCELECGRDIVVLLDSITRLGRAFNVHGAGTGRTMTGGLDAKALEIPRRFFGLARNIESGGSVTVIATALVDTGSRMDEHIFQEFKGTGNSEIVLDRSLAEARIFPAVNLLASGTRKEELLYNVEETRWLALLRRRLANADAKTAMLDLLQLLDKAPSNNILFQKIKLE
ncbi:MAG: transcription termination factor Rho [Desulforhabdus sp.]|jgi:transcription termination factor Rho|nr:transcription termination factor Rho [Desulforhabdus sp.]